MYKEKTLTVQPYLTYLKMPAIKQVVCMIIQKLIIIEV